MHLMVTDFPEPERPRITKSSPLFRLRFIPFRILFFPKDLCRFSIVMIGCVSIILEK